MRQTYALALIDAQYVYRNMIHYQHVFSDYNQSLLLLGQAQPGQFLSVLLAYGS